MLCEQCRASIPFAATPTFLMAVVLNRCIKVLPKKQRSATILHKMATGCVSWTFVAAAFLPLFLGLLRNVFSYLYPLLSRVVIVLHAFGRVFLFPRQFNTFVYFFYGHDTANRDGSASCHVAITPTTAVLTHV